MHRLHALRLALLCCAVVAVLAGCGGSKVQYNYASLANEICGTWTDATNSNPPPAVRLKAIETALSGLQGLNPPNTVENLYAELLYHFNAAVNILKPNMVTLTRLANHLQNQPDDKSAQRRYAALGGLRIQHHLQSAANVAHTLALGRCEAAFGGSSS